MFIYSVQSVYFLLSASFFFAWPRLSSLFFVGYRYREQRCVGWVGYRREVRLVHVLKTAQNPLFCISSKHQATDALACLAPTGGGSNGEAKVEAAAAVSSTATTTAAGSSATLPFSRVPVETLAMLADRILVSCGNQSARNITMAKSAYRQTGNTPIQCGRYPSQPPYVYI